MKKYDVMNSKDSYFSLMVKPAPPPISFVGTKALNILNLKCDNLGSILIIEVKNDDSVFVQC